MTDREALLACRQSVAFDLGQWERKLRRDKGLNQACREHGEARVAELKRLLDWIDNSDVTGLAPEGD